MKKYLIESVRVGITEGGMACGPVSGHVLAEVKYRDENGVIRYRSLAEVDGTLNFFNTQEETFDAQIAEEWEPDHDREFDPAYAYGYEDYDSFYDDLPARDPQEAQLDKYLAFMVRASESEIVELKAASVGKYIGNFAIPICDAEQDHMEAITDAEAAMERILELLDEDNTCEIDELVDEFEDELDTEEIFREAVRRGAEDYVRCHADDFDLNDFDFGSSVLAETDDPDIREILIDAGAVPDPDDFSDCRFYYDSCSEELEMDDSLEDEMQEKLLNLIGYTRGQFTDKLRNEETAEENLPAPLDEYTFADIQGITMIADEDDIGEDVDIPDAWTSEVIDLLDKLGFNVCQEGLEGAHGHGSWTIYYIR